ncbi:MAG: DUF881 domain-containing protein [bacterium]
MGAVKTRGLFLSGAAFILGVSLSGLSGSLRGGDFAGVGTPGRETEPSRREHVLAGTTPVIGRGLRIVIADAGIRRAEDGSVNVERMLVHEKHLLMLTNELFAAGAEAVSVNGERLTAVTAVRCVGPAVRINDVNAVPPFEVKAVGSPQVLKRSITMMGGVVDSLSAAGIEVKIYDGEELRVEPYRGTFRVRFAR